jgi:DNA mismatch endonuclease (patch repair protein)
LERFRKCQRQLLGLAVEVEGDGGQDRPESQHDRLGEKPASLQYRFGCAMIRRIQIVPDGAYDRSAVMRAVKSRDTSPELAVRALLRPIAPGYRLHRGDLPGKPDVVYASRKIAIFVHGCFWHGHDCARGARAPKTNSAYWRAKIARNRERDEKTLAAYAAMGWRALVVYECDLKDKAALRARLEGALKRE